MIQMPRSRDPLFAYSPEACLQIEFFGLPGSGKTTIAREVHKILSRSRPDLLFAPELLRDEAGAKARAAAKLRLILSELGGDGIQTVRKVFAIRQAHLRDKARAVFSIATVMSLYNKITRRGADAVLDQGLLQALWSVQLRAADGGSAALVAATLKDAARSGRIHISVETPPAICAKRLGSRGSKHSRMQETTAARDHTAWESAEMLRQTLLGNLRAAYRKQGVPPRMIVVDGTADPVQTATQIVTGLLCANSDQVLPEFAILSGVRI